MNVKKRAFVFLLVAFLFSIPAGFAEIKEDIGFNEYKQFDPSKLKSGSARYIGSVVMASDAFYVYMDDYAVYSWSPAHDQYYKVCQLPKIPENAQPWTYATTMSTDMKEVIGSTVSYLVTDGINLYGFNRYSGKICMIKQDSYDWLPVTLDMSSFMNGGSPRGFLYAFIKDDILYSLVDYDEECENSPYYNFNIVTHDLKTGATKVYHVFGIQNFCIYKEGSLLLLRHIRGEGKDEYKTVLSSLDLQSGQVDDMDYIMPNADTPAGGIVFDDTSNTIYYTNDGNVMRSVSGTPFKPVTAAPPTFDLTDAPAWLLSQGDYAIWSSGITVLNIGNEERSNNKLTIQAAEKNDKIYSAFMEKNPDAMVVWNLNRMSAADIAEEIRRGNTETDIFEVMVDASFSALKEKGYAAALSDSSIIQKESSSLYPSIQSVIMNHDGMPIAYPNSLYYHLWQVDLPLWKKYFGNEDLPNTWVGFFDAMKRFEEAYGDAGDAIFLEDYDYENLVSMIIDSYIRQYENNGQMDFCSEKLAEALQKLAQIHDIKKARNDRAAERSNLSDDDMTPVIFFQSGGGNQLTTIKADSEYSCIDLMPFCFEEGDTPIIPGYLTVLVINPLTTHRELALKYIECATTMDANIALYYSLHPNANDPVMNKNYEAQIIALNDEKASIVEALSKAADQDKKMLEGQLQLVDWRLGHKESEKWTIAAEGISAYRTLAPNIRFFENSLYVNMSGRKVEEQITGLCSRYCGGQITLKAFQEQLTSVTELIYLESK